MSTAGNPSPEHAALYRAHVTHMGFELELAHDRLVALALRGTQDEMKTLVEHIKPAKRVVPARAAGEASVASG